MADSLTYNGIDFSAYGLTVEEFDEPWSPEPSVARLGSPGGGFRFYGAGYHDGQVTLPCAVQGSSTSDLRTKRDQLLRALDVRNNAKKLSIDAIPDLYWQAIPASSIPAPQLGDRATKFNLVFGLEGDGYGDTAVDSDDTSNPSIASDPDTFNIASPAGSSHASVVWYIRNTTGGEVTEITLTNNTRSEFITLTGALGDGFWYRLGSENSDGRWTFSLDRSTAGGADPTALSYTSVPSVLNLDGGDIPMLNPGVTNEIQVDGLISGTVRYVYRPRYIGG